MAADWLSIRVGLVSGRGTDFWPRPGRDIAVASTHLFGQLADAIDTAFARWDRAHLHQFVMTDGRLIGIPDEDDEFDVTDEGTVSLATLEPGERFSYEFDFGDSWKHLCTVGPDVIDPLQVLGIRPRTPLPYFGWGDLPDQHGRRWAGDDGVSAPPPDPGGADLPPGFR
jgi:hypothetical protein